MSEFFMSEFWLLVIAQISVLCFLLLGVYIAVAFKYGPQVSLSILFVFVVVGLSWGVAHSEQEPKEWSQQEGSQTEINLLESIALDSLISNGFPGVMFSSLASVIAVATFLHFMTKGLAIGVSARPQEMTEEI